MNKIGDSAISERKTCPNNCDFSCTTVDGRIPTPVDMVDIPFFAGFHTWWVVEDF